MPFEPEETVGAYWHRLVGGVSTYRRHPDAAVPLDGVRQRLGVMFRALGGSGAVRIVAGFGTESGHRLSLKQKVGLGREAMERPILDASSLRLPSRIDLFPDAADNAALYEWLAAWFAHAVPAEPDPDPLRADILRLRAAAASTEAALAAWPGLGPLYARLASACIAVRPRRRLPPTEAEVERLIVSMLAEPAARPPLFEALDRDRGALGALHAPRRYRPYLPVPLWGDVMPDDPAPPRDETEEPGGDSVPVDPRRRRATRRQTDQSARGDPLILHRFETIFSLTEMVNVNRKVEDDDEESARQAAEELPDLTIGSNEKRASTRLKLDLDLAPPEAEPGPIAAGLTYPEWDWRRGALRPDYCRVFAAPAAEEGEDWRPDAAMQRRIAQVRRQFEALRPKRQVVHGEPDGDELDLSALVRDVADRHAGGPGSERLYISARMSQRDLSIAVLMDVSLSTDSWLQDRRVLDVEKLALLALTHGLTACGDEHAIFTFTSRRRHRVDIATVKDFDERLGPAVVRRIEALKPGQYTRIGAAVRHVATLLADRPQRHRLMLILTDGKPNDIDHYEGRYGIEDTRMAIRAAREAGLRVFGATVDEHAHDYFPYIFGKGAYAIFPNISRLPTALPAIYRHITR
jgi:nitric oxide reductase NorD protein